MLTEDWIEWDGPYDALDAAGHAVPGVLVRIDDGRELLIGDVNDVGGVCRCCQLNAKIVAYRRVWEPDVTTARP
jgi:hypothetical protein